MEDEAHIGSAPQECASPEDHCPHIAGMVFGIGTVPGAPPKIMAQPKLCCKCGRGMVSYAGVVEQGHGPYVSYQVDPAVSPILRPQGSVPADLLSGMHRETRRV